MAHVSVGGFTAADAEDNAGQRHPGRPAAAQEISECVVRGDSLKHIWHIPVFYQKRRFDKLSIQRDRQGQ